MRRATAFIAVGALGFVVQLAALAALTSVAGWGWLPATLAAVELAVVHNFCWHARWTWSDRAKGATLRRFVAFNASNGAASLLGNAALMTLLVGVAGLPPVSANTLAVALIAVANFVVADRWVFGDPPRRGTRRPPCGPAPNPGSAAPAIVRAHDRPRQCGP
jgi:putative flippase GtrA